MKSGNAPAWNILYRRKTIGLHDNTVIEDIKVTCDLSEILLTRKLPNDVTGTKIVLYYTSNENKERKVEISAVEIHELFVLGNKVSDREIA